MVLFALTACGTGASDETATPDRSVELAPSFTPLQTERARAAESPGTNSSTTSTTPSTRESQERTTTQPAGTRATATTNRTPVTATATARDTTDDVNWTLQRPPDYTDIAAAKVTRTADGFTVRVRFTAELPRRQQDDNRTMNVATFYDTTGDGEIDYEIWANLADNSWGPSYRDRRDGEARFMADSDVRVAADGNSLVFRFPLPHLDNATTFQWATASEWGSYETISTAAAARDHAPNTGAAPFPD